MSKFIKISEENKWKFNKEYKYLYGNNIHGQNIIRVPILKKEEIKPPPGFDFLLRKQPLGVQYMYINVPVPVNVHFNFGYPQERNYSYSNNYTQNANSKLSRDWRKPIPFCGNCNKRGHLYKNCNNEIVSYGIIAFRRNTGINCSIDKLKELGLNETEKSTRILLVQRKDTMAYVDFLRARYPDNPEKKKLYIAILFSEMIPEERNRLKTWSFDDLWDNLWVNHNSKCYKSEKTECKQKFNEINISWYLGLFNSEFTFTEFGIPKGRKNKFESDQECAIREFSEETGYPPDSLIHYSDEPFIVESFVGTNGKRYKHVYYLAELKKNYGDPILDPTDKNQIGEVKDIIWLSSSECNKVTRFYDYAKLKVFETTFNFLETN